MDFVGTVTLVSNTTTIHHEILATIVSKLMDESHALNVTSALSGGRFDVRVCLA